MYRFMPKQFIALFVYLSFALSSLFLPKMRGLTVRRKTGAVSVEVFTFHHQCTFSFRTAHGNRRA